MNRRSRYSCCDRMCGADDCANCHPFAADDAPEEREEAEPREWDDADDASLDGEAADRSDRFHEAQLRKNT